MNHTFQHHINKLHYISQMKELLGGRDSTTDWQIKSICSKKYSQVSFRYRDLIHHNITYDAVITVAESESDIRITTVTP